MDALPLLNPYADLLSAMELPRDPERLREIRRKLVWAFAWAVPSREAVLAAAACSPILEVGAGTGYWAWLLRQAGADVLAVDGNPAAPPHWSPVVSGGPELAGRHPERTLFLCWPPMNEAFAADCLRAYSGERVIHVGEEGAGARTGDTEFRRLLSEGFEAERAIELPRWPGYEDRMVIYQRRQEKRA